MTGLGGTEGTGEGLDAGVCAVWATAVGSGGKSRQAGGSGVPPTGWPSQQTDLPQVLGMPQDPLIRPNLTSQGASCHGHVAEARQNNPDLGPDLENPFVSCTGDQTPLNLSILLCQSRQWHFLRRMVVVVAVI